MVANKPLTAGSSLKQYRLQDFVSAYLGRRGRGEALEASFRASGAVIIGPGSRSREHRAGVGLTHPWTRVGVSDSATGRVQRRVASVPECNVIDVDALEEGSEKPH